METIMGTSIKCTFYRLRCGDHHVSIGGCICPFHDAHHHDEYFDGCEYADDKPYMNENGMIAIPHQCKHVYRETVMFEKTVKQFEFDDDYLTVSKREIPVPRIEYLSIDGKEIIANWVKAR